MDSLSGISGEWLKGDIVSFLTNGPPQDYDPLWPVKVTDLPSFHSLPSLLALEQKEQGAGIESRWGDGVSLEAVSEL